ncbi:MAG TPA: dihydrofolate reductase family protein [Actinomycetota bacterium]|nr:dihydrofolate reductase family protein [Actinomycetota bacterium]
MGSTRYYTATSIDGYIADEHNSLDWLFQVPAEDDAEGQDTRFARFFADIGAMAMGSTTYEWILGHEGLLEHPERWHYGDTPCWVFSHRELPTIPQADLRFVRGQVAPVHREMVAAAGGKDVWIVGGGELVGQFDDAGLLDAIELDVAPVTLGAGAPLLPRRLTSSRLALVGVERHGHFVHETYRVRSEGEG